MGLEAYLIPLERPAPRLNGLDDLLVSPPDLAEPAGAPEAPAGVPPDSPPPRSLAAMESTPAAAPPVSPSVDAQTLARADLPLASPPEFVQATPAAPGVVDDPLTSPPVVSPGSIEPPAIDASRLEGFLASSVFEEPAATSSAASELVDDEAVVAPWSFVPPAAQWSPATTAYSTRSVEPSAFTAAVPSTSGGFLREDPGAGFDPIEDRLAQVVGRLEQAVDRLAAASSSGAGGSRSRAFRGRIDG